MKALRSRVVAITSLGMVVAAFLLFAFWPRPIRADIATVARGPLVVTIDEEAKTRVRESYVVSAPISARLLRIGAKPGAEVTKDVTIVAELTPAYPEALDIRTREQAEAAIEEARAALALSRAEARRAKANTALAEQEALRARELFKGEAVSKQSLDRAEIELASAKAALEAATAAVSMREAGLQRAQLMLMSPEVSRGEVTPAEPIAIRAPVSGHILRVFQESEAIVAAGTPILEIGDPHADLEVVAQLLSTDAVKVSPGDRVIIDRWGGEAPIGGVVDRIEPIGVTKVSALGVEEQRVNTVIAFDGGRNDDERLGDGFRVEVRIVIFERPDALKLPSSALLRVDGAWAVYKVVGGRAAETRVEIGRSNGAESEVLGGLREGDRVILYPGGKIIAGALVAPS